MYKYYHPPSPLPGTEPVMVEQVERFNITIHTDTADLAIEGANIARYVGCPTN